MQKLLDLEPELRDTAEHRPLTVKAIIVTSDDKILLLKRPKDGRWDLPGGGVDEGENLADALIREVCEETNLEIDNAIPVYTYLRAVSGKPEKLIQFALSYIKAKSSTLDVSLSHEHEDYAFFDAIDIRGLQIVPSYLEALRRAREEINKAHTPFQKLPV